MNKLYLLGAVALVVVGITTATIGGLKPVEKSATTSPASKIYVALEGEGAIAVLDGERNEVIKTISLTDERTGTMYMAHNAQASEGGGVVWVTANVMEGMGKQSFRLIPVAYASEGHGDNETVSDQLIAIDPETDEILRRIPMGVNQHLAHVVASPKGDTVFVAAQEADKLYVLDGKTMTVTRSIDLPKGSGPHGMRLSPDGNTIYAAFMGGKALGVVDVRSGNVEQKTLDGAAVQTAVAPDGSWVAVSVYDSKSVALYEPSTKSLSYVRLPEESQGPVQLYPTGDSQFLYVADQGVLNGRSASNKLYKIAIDALSVVEAVEAGLAPHGVVLNNSGDRAYVTNLKGNSVSVIDTKGGTEIVEVLVGREPNGITVWEGSSLKAAATPLTGASMTVYKSPTCGCCGNYIAELRRQGVEVAVKELSDKDLDQKKQELRVSTELKSCHTTVMDGYVIEGHVPVEAVTRLRTERPDIEGIALPGMPAGSPGMSGIKVGSFAVQTLDGKLFGNY